MNLLDTARLLQEDIDKREADLTYQFALIDGAKGEINKQSRELDEKAKALEVREKEVEAKLASIRKDEELSLLEVSLIERKSAIVRKEAELRVKENDLSEIETRQEEERRQLSEGQAALSKEKETYKETLKKEFFEEVSKRLPQ